MQLAEHNGNKPQRNEISTMETSHNTRETSHKKMKLAEHNGNKPQKRN